MGRLCNDELKDPNAVMKKIFTDRDHLCVFALTHKKYPSGKQLAEFAREINFSRTVPTIRAQLHNIINGKVKCQNTH